MNPGSFFREVLESHEFRLSDTFLRWFCHVFPPHVTMSDNANLLDITEFYKLGRFLRKLLAASAAMG